MNQNTGGIKNMNLSNDISNKLSFLGSIFPEQNKNDDQKKGQV